jgi:hypothetical protein
MGKPKNLTFAIAELCSGHESFEVVNASVPVAVSAILRLKDPELQNLLAGVMLAYIRVWFPDHKIVTLKNGVDTPTGDEFQ